MEWSKKKNKIFAAMVSAWADVPDILKNTKGQTGNQTYMYSDLATVLKCIRPAYGKHGLCVTQDSFVNKEKILVVETELLHKSGQWGKSTFMLDIAHISKIKEIGMHITYVRRYVIMSILGIACAEDDPDGSNEPFKKTYEENKKSFGPPPPVQSGAPIVPQQTGNGIVDGVDWKKPFHPEGPPDTNVPPPRPEPPRIVPVDKLAGLRKSIEDIINIADFPTALRFEVKKKVLEVKEEKPLVAVMEKVQEVLTWRRYILKHCPSLDADGYRWDINEQKKSEGIYKIFCEFKESQPKKEEHVDVKAV